MRLVQYLDEAGQTLLGCTSSDAGRVRRVVGCTSLLALAEAAFASGQTLEALAAQGLGALEPLPLAALIAKGRLLPPLTHPEPARCLVSGTGLTHLGSAATRDAMHQEALAERTPSDSMRMFKDGLAHGRPAPGTVGAQPEWFYKGDGRIVRAAGQPMIAPGFALDGGEEPELAGLYWIAPDGTPCRVGMAIGNEFSDHVLERQNYLLLAHSKLRTCAVGPELLTGTPPADLQGQARIRRGDGSVRWERAFATGEANMSHTLENLEYHHFKYAQHRRPGDIHVHFFGTATLSFADGVVVEPGEAYEIDLPALGHPLCNPLVRQGDGFAPGQLRVL